MSMARLELFALPICEQNDGWVAGGGWSAAGW